MNFIPDPAAIKDVFERRLLKVDAEIKSRFPAILGERSLRWITFGDDTMIGAIFVSPADFDRVQSYQQKNWHPFPGLVTTDPNQPAAFRLDKSRFIYIQSCDVAGFSFSLGRDCTLLLVDHTQEITTTEAGKLKYTLPLAYFVTFGDEITPSNIYEQLDALVAHSVEKWTTIEPTK